ncbi:MAG: hypothetical protein ACRDOL_22615 [Streptosporangiaceae bacterium]
MSDAISVAGKLPDGDGNGLMAIRSALIRRPHKCHVVIGIVDCSKITTDPDSGVIKPTARFRRLEVITDDDLLTAELLMQRALDARSGGEQMSFDLEADLRAAFKAKE